MSVLLGAGGSRGSTYIVFQDTFRGSTHETRVTSHIPDTPAVKTYVLSGNTGSTQYRITTGSGTTQTFLNVNENIAGLGGAFTTAGTGYNIQLRGRVHIGKEKTVIFIRQSSATPRHEDGWSVTFDTSANHVELASLTGGTPTTVASTAITLADGDILDFNITCRATSWAVHVTRSSNQFTHSIGWDSSIWVLNRGIGFGGTSALGANLEYWYLSQEAGTSARDT
jgi:hypothetical protein